MNLNHITHLLIHGHSYEIGKAVEQELKNKVPAPIVLQEGLLRGMKIIGTKFQDGIIFLPEVLVAAKAMKTAVEVLKPYLLESEIQYQGTVAIGTVKGDIHDIGKNLVIITLRGHGYHVVDLGIDCSTEHFLKEIETHTPDICGLSAMLTTTMISMKETVNAIKKRYPKQQIIVGGAPVNKNFAFDIGADGYGKDASRSIEVVNRLMKNQKEFYSDSIHRRL